MTSNEAGSDVVSAVMRAIRAKAKGKSCVRSAEHCRRAQALAVEARKRNKEGKVVGVGGPG